MSYILEALRKSEEDRHQGRIPDLGAQSNLIRPAQKKSVLWPVLIVVALFINGAGLFFWLGDRPGAITATQSPALVETQRAIERHAIESQANEVHASEFQPKALPVQPVYQEPIQSKPVVPVNVQHPIKPDRDLYSPNPVVAKAIKSETITPEITKPEVTRPEVTRPETTKPEENKFAKNRFADIPYVSELDRSIQKKLPSFTFNSHIFSSDPSARRAMINNIYLHEGQRFSGVILEAVIEDAVVLNADGIQFRLPALKDWSYQ